MQPTLTVVIPALNEAERLPGLLAALERQTRRPDAVVVADAGSTDGTRELAAAAGARVVAGGMPAVGRNAGAAIADTDLIVFLDADVDPVDTWIEQAVAEFVQRKLGSAAGRIAPIEDTAANVVACEAANLYLQLMQYAAPHAPGFCILARRDVHKRIGGFDETVMLAEDHDYVRRAAEVAKFRVLRCDPIRVSMRRIEKEGILRLAFMYLYSEMHVVSGRPIRSVPFEYEFAAWGEERERETVLAHLTALRDWLEKAAEPIATVSSGAVEKLRLFGETDVGPEAIERRLRDLAPEELRELHRYVAGRIEIARRMPPIMLRRARRAGTRLRKRIATGLDAGDETRGAGGPTG